METSLELVDSLSPYWLWKFPVPLDLHGRVDLLPLKLRVAASVRRSTPGFQRVLKVPALVFLSALTFPVKPSLVNSGLDLKDARPDAGF